MHIFYVSIQQKIVYYQQQPRAAEAANKSATKQANKQTM